MPRTPFDKEKFKTYAGNTAKLASVIESLTRSEGWQVFRAMFERKAQEIKDKTDYGSLEDFKADRRAIQIFEDILMDFEGYIEEHEEAKEVLSKLAADEGQTPGSLVLDSVDGETGMEG